MGEHKNDGGFAFPQFAAQPTPGGGVHYDLSGGMSLRDAAALAALPALMQTCEHDPLRPHEWASQVAYDAFKVADAFIAARGDQ